MGYYHPVAKKGNQADLARQYGVKGVNYGTKNNLGGQQIRTVNDVERDISSAMANDYSTREFLKYNEDARDKMKNGLPSNRKQNSELHSLMQEAHKDAGNGGKFDNRYDRAGVAQSAFEGYEAEQQAAARKYTDKRFDKLKNQMDKEADGSGSNASKNMTFNEYMENSDTQKATEGFSDSAKAGAQNMLTGALQRVAADKDTMDRGKAKQGQFVLSNLGSGSYQSNEEGF